MGAPNVFRYYEQAEKPKDAPKSGKPVVETALSWLLALFLLFMLGKMGLFLALHELFNPYSGYYR